jgi:hypothetical protein
MFLFNLLKELFLKLRHNDATSKSVFDHYFFDSKYYLLPTASTEDFAPILNIDTHSLDKISVAYYGFTFSILINEYRYKHFMQELEHPYNENLTIESMIKLSGFENNESFVKYVKENANNHK